MVAPSMKDSHLLEGASNFVPRKLRLQSLLEMIDLLYLLEKVVALHTNPIDVPENNKKAMNVKQTLLDSMKDSPISHIVGNNTTKHICDAFKALYQSVNVSKNMLLKKSSPLSPCMRKTYTMASYLMESAKLKD
jgi:hypothetical protein